MTSELVSGPDLGAGFLHQLSRDTDGPAVTFTYHAQIGGPDANGPPLGPLDPFGSVHPPTPCMFGGPRCWHRRFRLPFEATPRVRQAYQRYRFVLQAMVDQQYAGAAAPAEAAVREVVSRLAAPLADAGVEWYFGGSTAAWLLGSGVPPHDLDLGTTRPGVDRVADRLAEYLIEPLGATDWPSAGIVHGARAFVGTLTSGMRAEWSVPIGPEPPEPLGEWTGRPGVARLERATFDGVGVRVSRPEYALVRAAEHGRADRADALARFVRDRGVDAELLGVLLERSRLSSPGRADLRRAVGAR